MKADHRRLSEEQQQEYVSRDQFASRLSEYGWLADDISRDVGEDFMVRIFDKGMSSGLGFLVQLKSVSNLDGHQIQGGYTSYRLDVGDLLHWEASAVPVFVVIWDVNREYGCWIGVPEAIEELSKRRPAWRDQQTARVRIPSSNRTDDEGLEHIRKAVARYYYPVIAKGKTLEIHARFLFPTTPEGTASRLALERHFATGEPVEIDGSFVEELVFSEWWTRLWGEIDLSEGQLALGPRPSDRTVPVRLDLLSWRGQNAAIPYIDLRATMMGSDQLTCSNQHQPVPWRLEFVFRRAEQSFSMTVEVTGPGSNVEETLEILFVMRALAEGGRCRITFRETGQAINGDLPAGSANIPHPEFISLVDKLCLIQRQTGHILALPFDWSLDVADIDSINELVTIFETGQTTLHNQVVTGCFKKYALGLFLEPHQAGKPIQLRIVAPDGYVELLGERIHVGPFTQHISGTLDVPVAKLEEIIARMEPDDELEVRLIDADVVEEFDDWPKSGN
jgi:hypothetical protein